MSESRWRRLRPFAAVALLAAVTFVVGSLSLRALRIEGVGSPIIWPATAIAVAIVIRCPRRWWWALGLGFAGGYLAANLSINTWPLALMYLLTGVVELAVASIVLVPVRGRRQRRLRTQRDAARFVAATVAAITAGAALIALAAVIFPADVPAYSSLLGYLLAHGLGMLVVAPLLMPNSMASRHQGRHLAEFLVVLAATVALGWWIFLTDGDELYPHPLTIPVIWAAIRFGPLRATLVLATATALAAYGTAHGLGPFAVVRDPSLRDYTAQLFLVTLAVSALALVVVIWHHSELTERARASEETLSRAIRDSTAGMYSIRLDAEHLGEIRDVNTAFATMLGYCPEDLIGRHCAMLGAGDGPKRELLDGYLRRLADGTMADYREESQFYRATGDPLWVQTDVGRVQPLGEPPFALVHVHDLTVRERNRAQLEHLAMHDALTGLANRTLLFQRLDAALGGARSSSAVGLLYLDLDGFKEVNDRFGHDAGDAVLVEVARRLIASARPADTVARLGGDEFAVLCPALADRELLDGVAARLRASLRAPIPLPAGGVVSVDVSVGIGATDGSDDVDTLLRRADQAMYVVKQGRRALPAR